MVMSSKTGNSAAETGLFYLKLVIPAQTVTTEK